MLPRRPGAADVWPPAVPSDSWALIRRLRDIPDGSDPWGPPLPDHTNQNDTETLLAAHSKRLRRQPQGLKWPDVVWQHALIITIVGFMVGSLIAGAVVVESIFSWPGIGRLLVVSVANRDLAVVQCILLMIAATMVVSNFVVDLLYGWLDPRLRAQTAH